MCDACCLKWPMRSMPALFTVGDGGIAIGEKHVRVCYSCDGAAQAFRIYMLAGDYGGAMNMLNLGANVNLRCHLPPAAEGQQVQMLPVHLAAAANSLPALRWLAEGEGCALVGTGAMTVGRPPKSVFQVALEAEAVDVLQWLVSVEDAPVHVRWLPIPMPVGCMQVLTTAPSSPHRCVGCPSRCPSTAAARPRSCTARSVRRSVTVTERAVS